MRKVLFSIFGWMLGVGLAYASDLEEGSKAYEKQDYTQALPLFEKACSGGSAKGCSNLGFMHYKGEGVKQDSAKALGLFDKACQMKHESGCKNYAILKKQDVKVMPF